MLSSLPDLSPRDSYALWYAPTHHSNNTTAHIEPVSHAFDQLAPTQGQGQNGGPQSQRRANPNAHRTPLARLRADEIYMERRKHNVQNYGSGWIKPPGIFKSLHQLREERREMEEHQEALRREQLAQELAEADAGEGDLLQGEGADGEMDEARDLDDDIPDAETTGLDGDDSENEEEGENVTEAVQRPPAHRQGDMYRAVLGRGQEGGANVFGGEGGSLSDEEDQSQMLQEEDLVHEGGEVDMDMGMDMDADLDDDVPEAEEGGGYEHTDTEEELSSSEDDDSVDMGRLPQGRTLSTSMVRSDGTQHSMDLSGIGLRGGSSVMGSSPRTREFMTDGRRSR